MELMDVTWAEAYRTWLKLGTNRSFSQRQELAREDVKLEAPTWLQWIYIHPFLLYILMLTYCTWLEAIVEAWRPISWFEGLYWYEFSVFDFLFLFVLLFSFFFGLLYLKVELGDWSCIWRAREQLYVSRIQARRTNIPKLFRRVVRIYPASVSRQMRLHFVIVLCSW